MVLTSFLRSRFLTGASRAQSPRSFLMDVKSILFLATLFVCLQPTLLGQTQSNQKVTTVDFCELSRNPQRYFNRTVRIKAQWLNGDEFSYLTDDRCLTKVAHDIAVRFVNDETQREVIKQSVYKIMSHEYGGRAMITAVGVLRNPGEYHGYFRYLFELIRFEEIVHVVVPYESTLDAGKTYRAVVRGDQGFGLILVPPLRMFTHQAVSIEWTNLSDFPTLTKLRDSPAQQLIVFSVISDESKQMTTERWNRTVKCKIVRVE
jgi:hypothetical protein